MGKDKAAKIDIKMHFNCNTIQEIIGKISLNPNGCWDWTGSKTLENYGRFHFGGKRFVAHRFFYDMFGQKPNAADLDLHHKCENTLCVRPAHLIPTTKPNHVLNLTPRAIAYQGRRRTHCSNDHELTEDNVYRYGKYLGVRVCKTCRNAEGRAYRQKQKAKGLVCIRTKEGKQRWISATT